MVAASLSSGADVATIALVFVTTLGSGAVAWRWGYRTFMSHLENEHWKWHREHRRS